MGAQRTADLFAPAPLWAQECIACGHRQRYVTGCCSACLDINVRGRPREEFEQHYRDCQADRHAREDRAAAATKTRKGRR